MKGELINMTRAEDQEKKSPRQESNSWPPEQQAGALSTELPERMERRVIKLSSYVTGVLHTAKISTVEVKVSSDKWIKMVLSKSSRSSVNRAPARCSGARGFDSCRWLRFCLCPTLVSFWSIHRSNFITKFKIYHLFPFIDRFVIRYRTLHYSLFVSSCLQNGRTRRFFL